MEIGISTASYFPRLLTEDCFAMIEECGAKVCEVFLATFSEYSNDFAEVLKQKQRCKVHSIHALTNQFEPELISRGSRAFDDSCYWFNQVCFTGEKLGAECYTFHGPTLLKKIKYVFDYPFIAERLVKFCDIADSHGLTLTYENVHWAYGAYPEYLKKILELVPSLGACLDIKQAMQAGYSYKEYVEAMGSRIKTVHLCDYDDNGKLLMPSKGKFDFVEMFKILGDICPDATCLLEVYSSSYDGFSEIEQGFNYLKECAYKANIKID